MQPKPFGRHVVTITCVHCGAMAEKPEAEIRRQRRKGRDRFFCSLSCAAFYNRSVRSDRCVEVVRVCPICDVSFKSKTGVHGRVFCSRSCASRGSMTAHRLARAVETGKQALASGGGMFTMESRAKGQRVKEYWKYVEVAAALEAKGIAHDFEYVIDGVGAVYDLALHDQRLLIEFDGYYHLDAPQAIRDAEKDRWAIERGWSVQRVATPSNCVISASSLDGIL